MKSSTAIAPFSESIQENSIISSPRKSFSTRIDEDRAMEDNLDKELCNNGEYLIRPYLLGAEKIILRYDCERVVGLDKHDGIFLIGELYLYVIQNFYIDQSGCIYEKETEDEVSVIDQTLGVTRDFSMSMDSQSNIASSWGAIAKAHTGGRACAYNGGAWGKEKVGNIGNVPHLWRIWRLNSVHEMLKRDYQLHPVLLRYSVCMDATILETSCICCLSPTEIIYVFPVKVEQSHLLNVLFSFCKQVGLLPDLLPLS